MEGHGRISSQDPPLDAIKAHPRCGDSNKELNPHFRTRFKSNPAEDTLIDNLQELLEN